MTEKREKPFDVQATNPFYRGAMMSDIVQVLFRPINPKVWERIATRRFVTPEKVEDDEPDIKTGV